MTSSADDPTGPAGARRTALHAMHLRRGAKMVPFAGYDMPLHYAPGLLREHLHTRAAAGLFDVSHMGQIEVVPRSGDIVEAAAALEALIPIDIVGLPRGRQRYGFLTNDQGGILDDLMVARVGDRLIVVVNAAGKSEDAARLHAHLSDRCEVSLLPRALIALQGPLAAAVLAPLAPDTAAMAFMDVRDAEILGAPCVVARSGYTGEDGFEISLPDDRAEAIAEALLADERVLPIGLGARDSLRLEAGLCLHGADIDATTTPVEAGLTWAIPKVRRRGGARAGGFPGADRILHDMDGGHPPPSETGADARRRVGLRPEGRAPVRAGASIYASEATTNPVGTVTSGGFGPSLGAPVAMGYVPAALAAPDTRVFAEVRGQRMALRIAQLPFVPAGYKRG